jgi:hypothetical protein
MIIQKWALCDKMPIREIARRTDTHKLSRVSILGFSFSKTFPKHVSLLYDRDYFVEYRK